MGQILMNKKGEFPMKGIKIAQKKTKGFFISGSRSIADATNRIIKRRAESGRK